MNDPAAQRVASPAGQVSDLREQFQVFGNISALLMSFEQRAATAERALREAERREAAAMCAVSELEAELADALAEPPEAIRAAYRRGYETGYSAARRGADQNPDPKPRRARLRSVGAA